MAGQKVGTMWMVNRVAGAALGLFALVAVGESLKLPLGTLRQPGPGYMPLLLALCLLGFSALVVAGGGRAPRLGEMAWTEWRHALAILGMCCFSAVALERLGFRVTILLALAFLLKVTERKGWVATVAFAAGMAFGTFFLFERLLRVPLPRGPFGL